MPKFWYGQGAVAVAQNDIDLVTSTLKCMLLMSNTTCDTEPNVITRADFTDADEFDGSGYTAGGITLIATNVSYTTVPDERVEISAADANFGTLFPSATGRSIYAYLVYDEATDRPLIYDDTPLLMPFTVDPGGEVVRINWSTSGWTYWQSNPLP